MEEKAKELGPLGSMVSDGLMGASLLYAESKKDASATMDFWNAVKELADLMIKVDLECAKARAEVFGRRELEN